MLNTYLRHEDEFGFLAQICPPEFDFSSLKKFWFLDLGLF
jgi:hypothetical protein